MREALSALLVPGVMRPTGPAAGNRTPVKCMS